jgi:tetrahydromethanopterin S-methyltransferase subunit G
MALVFHSGYSKVESICPYTRNACKIQPLAYHKAMHDNNAESPVTKADLAELMGAIGNRFDSVDRRFDGIDRRFEAVDERFQAIDAHFDSLQQDINGVREDLRGFKGETREGFSEVHTRLDALKEDVDAIASLLVTRYATKATIQALDRRVKKLETRSA